MKKRRLPVEDKLWYSGFAGNKAWWCDKDFGKRVVRALWLHNTFWKRNEESFFRKNAAATADQGGVGVPAKSETCPEWQRLCEQGRYKRVAIPIKVCVGGVICATCGVCAQYPPELRNGDDKQVQKSCEDVWRLCEGGRTVGGSLPRHEYDGVLWIMNESWSDYGWTPMSSGGLQNELWLNLVWALDESGTSSEWPLNRFWKSYAWLLITFCIIM